jgi:Tol biopolymer transport system component
MGRCVPLIAGLVLSLALAASAYAGTFPGRNGRIAFTANVGDRSQVFTMNSKGHDVRQLSNEAAGAADPDWAPGGAELLYARSDGLASLIAATGALSATVTTQEPISDPAISPDGKRLVFTVNGDGLTDGPSIYVANVDGTGLQRLAPGSNPDWSADGAWIAYVSVPADTGCSGVRLMAPDGSDDHPVAQGLPDASGACRDGATEPSFSPDSKRVLYVATDIKTPHKQNGTDLYTVSIHGGAHKRLTKDDLNEAYPVFSPSGKRVLFSASGGRGRQNGTFTISAAGKHRHRIGPPLGGLSWQPLPAG